MKKNAHDFFEEKTRKIGTETGTLAKRIFDRPYLADISSNIEGGKMRKVHITGVCGKATSSLAGLFAESGYEVSGSDVGCYSPASDLIDKLGIKFYEGFSEDHVKDKDLTVIANMFGPDNVEAKYVREHGLVQLSMSEAISEFFIKDRKSIVICGTHGKTTTTGLMTHVFITAGLNPGFLVGGVAVPTKDGIQETSFSAGLSGSDTVSDIASASSVSDSAISPISKHFIIEGDEYDTAYFDKSPKFLHYKPSIAVVTSLEFDHADIYSDYEEYKKSFIFLAEEMMGAKKGGLLVLNGDFKEVRSLAQHTEANVLYYGLDKRNDLFARDVVIRENGQSFSVFYKDENIGTFSIQLFGEYNLLNALSVIAASLHEGLSVEQIRNGLSTFKGMKRRQEILAVVNGVTVIDDFAHHPTAVRETLAGMREHFPKSRIFAVFEPRSNTSRKKMFEDDYSQAFTKADGLFLSMPDLRRNDNPADFINGTTVIEKAKKVALNKDFYAVCVAHADQVVEKVLPVAKPGDVFVVMSNGSFDGVHEKLIKALGGALSKIQ